MWVLAPHSCKAGSRRCGLITVEKITGADTLEALRDQWSSLYERCPQATPFQAPEWLAPWIRLFAGDRLIAFALWDAGRLTGIVPFFAHVQPESRIRQLLLAGAGAADYLDALFESGFAMTGAKAVFDHLAAQIDGWDECDLTQLRPGSPLLDAPAPVGLASQILTQDVCPVLALPSAAEDLMRMINRRLRDNLRYYRRRAARIGAVSFESACESNFEELFASLLRLHGARWAARGSTGALDNAAIQNFHHRAAAGMLRRGSLRLYAMRVGGRIVAVYYGFLDRRRAYYYLSGFDPEYDFLSPGTLVVSHSIEEAIREGAVEFDFLRGQESYKYLWGAQDRSSYRRYLRRSTRV